MSTTATQKQRPARRNVRFLDELSDEDKRLYEHIPSQIDCVYHDSFGRASTEGSLFGPDGRVTVPQWRNFSELPADTSRHLKPRAKLSAADEVKLFLRYNYARHRLGRLIEAQRRRASARRASGMVLWYKRAMEARADLVRANMALVLTMARRTRILNVEFGELVSEGNMALLRSVEKFDVARGFKFSTYACRAILKSFSRLATKTGHYRRHFPTEFDPQLERSDYDVNKHDMQRADSVDALRDIIAENRAELTDIERTIIMERFALGSRGERSTLAQVGKLIGLTNERVRQIQNTAIGKIRTALEDHLAT